MISARRSPSRGQILVAVGALLLTLGPWFGFGLGRAAAAGEDFTFSSTAINVDEGNGFLLHIHGQNVPDGAVVNVASSPITATMGGPVQQTGDDFPFTASTVHCDSGTGMPGPCDFDLPVFTYQDALAEGNETFQFTLSNPTPNTLTLGPPAIITIVDDEAPPPPPSTTTTTAASPPFTFRGPPKSHHHGSATPPGSRTPTKTPPPPPSQTPGSPTPGSPTPGGPPSGGPQSSGSQAGGTRVGGAPAAGSARRSTSGRPSRLAGKSSRAASAGNAPETVDGTPADAAPGDGSPRQPSSGTRGNSATVRAHELSFTRSVKDPTEINFSLNALARNLVLAGGLVLLVVFPGQLFERTLEENEGSILGWLRRGELLRTEERLARIPIWIVLCVYTPLAAFFLSFLEPDFGWNAESLRLYVALLIALPTLMLFYDLARAWFMRRRYGVQGRLAPQFVALAIAGALVFASRATHIQPGYMYGALASLHFIGPREPTVAEEGKGIAFGSLVLGVVAFSAWFLLIPVNHAARHPGAGAVVLTLQSVLAIVWVGGLGTITFGLAPIRFFYGEKVKAWKSSVWFAMYAVAVFVYVELLLRPDAGLYARSEEASATQVTELFIGFGIFSVLFWAYFRVRRARPVALSAEPTR